MNNPIDKVINDSHDRHEASVVENTLRSLSLGLKPLTVEDPRTAQAAIRHCDGCGEPERDSALLVCASCRLVNYCSVQCQRGKFIVERILYFIHYILTNDFCIHKTTGREDTNTYVHA